MELQRLHNRIAEDRYKGRRWRVDEEGEVESETVTESSEILCRDQDDSGVSYMDESQSNQSVSQSICIYY